MSLRKKKSGTSCDPNPVHTNQQHPPTRKKQSPERPDQERKQREEMYTVMFKSVLKNIKRKIYPHLPQDQDSETKSFGSDSENEGTENVFKQDSKDGTEEMDSSDTVMQVERFEDNSLGVWTSRNDQESGNDSHQIPIKPRSPRHPSLLPYCSIDHELQESDPPSSSSSNPNCAPSNFLCSRFYLQKQFQAQMKCPSSDSNYSSIFPRKGGLFKQSCNHLGIAYHIYFHKLQNERENLKHIDCPAYDPTSNAKKIVCSREIDTKP